MELNNKSSNTIEQKEIIVLVGAGISNLFGLPMTSGFTSLISEGSRFEMNELLSNYLGRGISDIEKVMFTLEDCLDNENQNIRIQKFLFLLQITIYRLKNHAVQIEKNLKKLE